MRRREFAKLVRPAVSWPVMARAQQKAMPVIGYLRTSARPPRAAVFGRVPPGTERNRLRRGTKRGDRIPLGGGPL